MIAVVFERAAGTDTERLMQYDTDAGSGTDTQVTPAMVAASADTGRGTDTLGAQPTGRIAAVTMLVGYARVITRLKKPVTIYAGMMVDLKVRGTDGHSRAIITDAGCTIYLFGPPKNPLANPGDRTDPDYAVAAEYDPVSRYYLASISSQGWTPGTWWMQGVLSGGANGYYAFDFERFTVSP